MNLDEIMQLIEMLCEATQGKKIIWSLDNISGCVAYKTTINECDIIVTTDYNPLHDSQVGMIDLYNTNGNKFLSGRYFEDENTEVYLKIKVLCFMIQDQLFLVSESKDKIFSSLTKLLEKS